MSEQTDLGAILDARNDTPQAPMAPVERQEPPQGDKQPGAEPPAAASQEAPEPNLIPRDALLDERRKRQELEKQVRELTQRMQQQPPQEQQKPDWFTDPETAAEYLQREVQRQIFEDRVHRSEETMLEKYPDYAEKRDLFAEAAAQDPILAQRLVKHPNPAKFAYDVGKKIALQRDIGDNPDAYRQKIEAEILKKYGIDPNGQAAQPQQPRATAAPVPRSLAKEASAPARAPNGRFVPTNGPTPLEDLIG